MDRRCIFRHYDDRHIRYDGISDSVDDKGNKGVVDMNKEKQIEEIYEDLVEIFDEEYNKRNLITPQYTAVKMTAKSYRKASDIAREILEEILKAHKYCGRQYNGWALFKEKIIELKKKYEVEA